LDKNNTFVTYLPPLPEVSFEASGSGFLKSDWSKNFKNKI